MYIGRKDYFEKIQSSCTEEGDWQHQEAHQLQQQHRGHFPRPFHVPNLSGDSWQRSYDQSKTALMALHWGRPELRRLSIEPQISYRHYSSYDPRDIEALPYAIEISDERTYMRPSNDWIDATTPRTLRQKKIARDERPDFDEWDELDEGASKSFVLEPKPLSRHTECSERPSRSKTQPREETTRSRYKISTPSRDFYVEKSHSRSRPLSFHERSPKSGSDYSMMPSPSRSAFAPDSENEPGLARTRRYSSFTSSKVRSLSATTTTRSLNSGEPVESMLTNAIQAHSNEHSVAPNSRPVSPTQLSRKLKETDIRLDYDNEYGFASALVVLANNHFDHAHTLLDSGSLGFNLNLITQKYLNELEKTYPESRLRIEKQRLQRGEEIRSPVGSAVLSYYVELKFYLKKWINADPTSWTRYRERFYVTNMDAKWELLLGNQFLRDNEEARQALHHLEKTPRKGM